MKAVEERKVALDEDINNYLPFKVINPNFPDEKITLGHLATHTSGLKRISDKISYSVKKLYKEKKVDIEPHWYLVFMLLRSREKLSIAKLAESLGYSHPTLVITVKKMDAKGYLVIEKDPNDKRNRMVSLSEKSIHSMPQFDLLWNSCKATILNILNGYLGILDHLDNIDASLEKTSFYYNFKQEYSKNNLK